MHHEHLHLLTTKKIHACFVYSSYDEVASVGHKDSQRTILSLPTEPNSPTPCADVQWLTSAAVGHSILKVRCYFTACDASRMPAQHSDWNGICPVTTLHHVSSYPTLSYCERSNEELVVRLLCLTLLQAI